MTALDKHFLDIGACDEGRARIDLVDKPEDLLDGLLQFVVGASQVERPALGLEVIPRARAARYLLCSPGEPFQS